MLSSMGRGKAIYVDGRGGNNQVHKIKRTKTTTTAGNKRHTRAVYVDSISGSGVACRLTRELAVRHTHTHTHTQGASDANPPPFGSLTMKSKLRATLKQALSSTTFKSNTHTYMHAYLQYIHARILTIHIYMRNTHNHLLSYTLNHSHTLHTYICIHTYIHTYTHTYMHACTHIHTWPKTRRQMYPLVKSSRWKTISRSAKPS